MSDFIKTYLEWTAETESPTNYHIATALTMLAGACERKIWFNAGHGKIYPNLYMILVGPPATKKSTAAKLGLKLLKAVEGVNIVADRITKEKLWINMEAMQKEYEYEGVEYIHSSSTICATEWQFFIGDKETEFLNALNKAYDCEDSFDYETKNFGENHIKNIFLNQIGCIQPKVLANCLPPTAIGSGFTSRLIYVYESRPREANRRPILNPKIECKLISGLYTANKAIGEFGYANDDAENFHDSWYRFASKKYTLAADFRFAGFIDRLNEHMIKLAMLMSLSRTVMSNVVDYEITEADMKGALKWLERLMVRMPESYAFFGKSAEAELVYKVIEFVREKGKTNTKELLNAMWTDMSARDLTKVIETITKMKVMDVIYTGEQAFDLIWKEVKEDGV